MTDSTPERRPRILYVDDQVGNLTVFRASMRRYADVRTATSATEALQLLQTEEFPVVISDQRMEGMSGSELLARVRDLYPETIRILLTAHADFPSVVEALNQGRIARFIRKPWRRAELQQVIVEGTAEYERRRERQSLADQFLSRTSHLTLSQATAGFAEALQTQVEALSQLHGLMEQWGIQPGQSAEFDQLVDAVDHTRRLSQALISHVRRIEQVA